MMFDEQDDETRRDDVQLSASEPDDGGCHADGERTNGSPIGAWDLAKIDYLAKEIHLGAVGLLAGSQRGPDALHTISSLLYLAERCLMNLDAADQALDPLKAILDENSIGYDRAGGGQLALHVCEPGWIHDTGSRHRCVPKP